MDRLEWLIFLLQFARSVAVVVLVVVGLTAVAEFVHGRAVFAATIDGPCSFRIAPGATPLPPPSDGGILFSCTPVISGPDGGQ